MHQCGGADVHGIALRQSTLGGPLAVPVRHQLVHTCVQARAVNALVRLSLSFGEGA
jgi:hypothetical protein